MTVHILTPDATLFSGEAEYVGLPGSDGSMGIILTFDTDTAVILGGE